MPSRRARTIQFVESRQLYTEQSFQTRELVRWKEGGLGHSVESQPACHSLQDWVGTTLFCVF